MSSKKKKRMTEDEAWDIIHWVMLKKKVSEIEDSKRATQSNPTHNQESSPNRPKAGDLGNCA